MERHRDTNVNITGIAKNQGETDALINNEYYNKKMMQSLGEVLTEF